MDFDLKKFIDSININQLTAVAIVIFIIGILLLAVTFIIPVLAVGGAIIIIAGVIYIIYKAIGGK